MKEFDNLLRALAEGLRALSQGVESIAQKVEDVAAQKTTAESEESQAQKQKRPPKGAVRPSKPPKSKAQPASAVETVLAVIAKHPDGVDTDTLIQETGFERKKIHNIVYKLKRQSKIKSPRKGVYLIG